VTTVIERVSVETVLMVQMMKKNTILRFMGELSSRYVKLVFPEIEPHKCVKKNEKKEAEESTEKTDETIHIIYNPNRRSRGRRQTRQMRDIDNPTYIII
jgi:hypothetical protein